MAARSRQSWKSKLKECSKEYRRERGLPVTGKIKRKKAPSRPRKKKQATTRPAPRRPAPRRPQRRERADSLPRLEPLPF